MGILFNPVVVSVVVMMVLCLAKVNVMLSLLVAALTGGLVSGMGLVGTMGTIIEGMAGKNNVALSYILLGAMAAAISDTGIVKILCVNLLRVFGDKRKVTVLVIAGVACLSQNFIPVHIAFIPILIPPLLHVFNKIGLDRRAVACALTFGLKAPYMVVPVGFGLMFGGIVAYNMTINGMEMTDTEVWRGLLLPVLGMFLGLLFAIFVSYSRTRSYEDRDISTEETNPKDLRMSGKHWLTLVAIVIAFGTQVYFRRVHSTGLGLHLGTIAALIFMIGTGVIRFSKMDESVSGGIRLMGNITFIMLSAGGFGRVVSQSGGVPQLIDAITGVVGTGHLLLAFFMILVGLLVTIGIGTSFGTVPIIAAIYVPLALSAGFSPLATVCLIGTAGALGDAGSPASDSTLGPTAGLSVDGQHNHIYDTCVPTFLHFDIPLIIFGTIAAAFIL